MAAGQAATPRVLLADPETILTEGLRAFLDQDCDVVAAVTDGPGLVEAAARLRPDVVVAEVALPGLSGIEAVQQIKKDNPGVHVVFLTGCSDASHVREALAVGGSAYVLKTSSLAELAQAIKKVLGGGIFVVPQVLERLVGFPDRGLRPPSSRNGLSRREREVLRLIVEGHRTKEVAHRLCLSPRTVEFHKYRISDKLGIRGLAGLTRYALQHGLMPGAYPAREGWTGEQWTN